MANTGIEDLKKKFQNEIEGISEVVTYQGRTLSELVEAFHRAAKNYCEKYNYPNRIEYRRV